MQAFAVRSHGGHTYNQTAARPGAQHEDPRLVAYVVQSQITVEQLPIHCLCVVSLNKSLFDITGTTYIAPLKWREAGKVLRVPYETFVAFGVGIS